MSSGPFSDWKGDSCGLGASRQRSRPDGEERDAARTPAFGVVYLSQPSDCHTHPLWSPLLPSFTVKESEAQGAQGTQPVRGGRQGLPAPELPISGGLASPSLETALRCV